MIEVSEDFQGWPVTIKTLREMLDQLGFEEKDGFYGIPNNSELLDAYPRLFEDDGMAYGVNERYVTEASPDIYDTEIDYLKRNIKDKTIKLSDGKIITVPETIGYEKGKQKIKVFNMFREKTPTDEFIKCMNEYLQKENKDDENNIG